MNSVRFINPGAGVGAGLRPHMIGGGWAQQYGGNQGDNGLQMAATGTAAPVMAGVPTGAIPPMMTQPSDASNFPMVVPFVNPPPVQLPEANNQSLMRMVTQAETGAGAGIMPQPQTQPQQSLFSPPQQAQYQQPQQQQYQTPAISTPMQQSVPQPVEVSLDSLPKEPAMVLAPPPDLTTEPINVMTDPLTTGTIQPPATATTFDSSSQAPPTKTTDLLLEALRNPQAQIVITPQADNSNNVIEPTDVSDLPKEDPQEDQPVVDADVGEDENVDPDEFEFGDSLSEEQPSQPVMTVVDVAAMKAYIEEALNNPEHPYHAELAATICPLCKSHTPESQKSMYGNILDALKTSPTEDEDAQEAPEEPEQKIVSLDETGVVPAPEETTTSTVRRSTLEQTRTAFQEALAGVFKETNPVGKAFKRIGDNFAGVQSRLSGLFGFGGEGASPTTATTATPTTETPQMGGSTPTTTPKKTRKLDLLMGARGDIVLQGEFKNSKRYYGEKEGTKEKAKKAKKTRRHKVIKTEGKKLRLTKRKSDK